MDEQDQDTGNSQTMQNQYCLRNPGSFKNEHCDVLCDNITLTTFNNFEYQTTEQFTPVQIKEEIIECEIPKIEGSSDLPTKIEQGTVSANVKFFPKTIKQELDTSDVKVTSKVTHIKQEINECIQPKTESVVHELLTSECDLPTFKVESTDYHPDNYLEHTCSRKPLKNNSHVISKKKSRRYGCIICQNNFPSSKSRLTHIDGHFKKRYAVCQFCGRLMKKIEFFQHLFIHIVKNRMKNHIDDKPVKCNISFKTLIPKNIDEVDDKSFKCGTCFKTFNIKSKLRKHLITHSSEKPFKCDTCFKVFKQKSQLHEHIKFHSSDKPFKCGICSKGFNRNSDLRRHLIIHSGEKPFKCDICFKVFKQKSHLHQHLTIHNGEKPFTCSICSKGFTRKRDLQQHLIIHSENPFKCDICPKIFNRKSHLHDHLLSHSSEQPFKCDICSKRFKRNCDLKRHLLKHSR